MRSTSETRLGLKFPVEPKFFQKVSGGARKSRFCLSGARRCAHSQTILGAPKFGGNCSKSIVLRYARELDLLERWILLKNIRNFDFSRNRPKFLPLWNGQIWKITLFEFETPPSALCANPRSWKPHSVSFNEVWQNFQNWRPVEHFFPKIWVFWVQTRILAPPVAKIKIFTEIDSFAYFPPATNRVCGNIAHKLLNRHLNLRISGISRNFGHSEDSWVNCLFWQLWRKNWLIQQSNAYWEACGRYFRKPC